MPLFPEQGGLLPFLVTDNGDTGFWITRAKPEKWPILLKDARAPEFEVHFFHLLDVSISVQWRQIEDIGFSLNQLSMTSIPSIPSRRREHYDTRTGLDLRRVSTASFTAGSVADRIIGLTPTSIESSNRSCSTRVARLSRVRQIVFVVAGDGANLDRSRIGMEMRKLRRDFRQR